MARTVFIFGAGASRHAGAPVMADFYRRVVDIREAHSLPEHQPQFDLVVKASSQLDNVYAKIKMAYHENIEELFATFEMAQLLGRLGSLDGNELERLPGAMRSVIAATIEDSMLYPYGRDEGLTAPLGYSSFAAMLNSTGPASSGDLALITFNYDYGLDFALHAARMPFDYCLSQVPPDTSTIPLLKLHGSLNWGTCPLCKRIVPVTIDEWISGTQPVRDLGRPPAAGSDVSIYISQFLPKVRHEPCSVALEMDAFIVPPTFNKTQYHQRIAPVWRRALLELSQARNIFIIGYSVPDTDQFFRHLFALGLAGGPLVNTLTIVNPAGEAFERFRDMVGQKLKYVVHHLPLQFENSRAELRGALRSQGI